MSPGPEKNDQHVCSVHFRAIFSGNIGGSLSMNQHLCLFFMKTIRVVEIHVGVIIIVVIPVFKLNLLCSAYQFSSCESLLKTIHKETLTKSGLVPLVGLFITT